jgi:hypothetical protein
MVVLKAIFFVRHALFLLLDQDIVSLPCRAFHFLSMIYWHAVVLCAVMVVMEATLLWRGATLFKMVLLLTRYSAI